MSEKKDSNGRYTVASGLGGVYSVTILETDTGRSDGNYHRVAVTNPGHEHEFWTSGSQLQPHRNPDGSADPADMISIYFLLNRRPETLNQPHEITKEVYWHFLELLPPLRWNGRSFYMREMLHEDITSHFYQKGEKYFWEWARLPKRSR